MLAPARDIPGEGSIPNLHDCALNFGSVVLRDQRVLRDWRMKSLDDEFEYQQKELQKRQLPETVSPIIQRHAGRLEAKKWW